MTTDCAEGLGDKRAENDLTQLRNRLSSRLPRKCVVVDLAALGYPGDCFDSSGGAFDVFDLEQCLVGGGDEIVADMLSVEYPPLMKLPGHYVHCVHGVGLHGGAVVRKELRARSDCLLRDEIDPTVELDCRQQMIPYGRGTESDTTNDRVLRGYVGLLSGVPDVCSAANVDFLGYTDDCIDNTGGKFNVFDLKLCLFDSHRTFAQQALELAFPVGPVCGDGDVDSGEECDDGNSVQTDGCLDDCTLARCGDGFVRSGVEECDDGNSVQTDACLNNCKVAVCGDGVERTGVEECDDGNKNETDACRSNCKDAVCGDGITCIAASCKSGPGGSSEDCDDGNVVNGDGCSGICEIEFCGDGVINNKTEECDDGAGNGNAPNKCRLGTCKLPACGDGIIDDAEPFGESCDPPDGSACSAECRALLCGNGELDPGEECDDGAANSNTAPDACRTSCKFARCGDKVVDTGEQCDDGNQVDADACTASCKNNVCGDGVPFPGVEDCDDGAANSNTVPNACRTNCDLPGCGDNVIDAGEQCDDGNVVATDTCTDQCLENVCGDGIQLIGLEECDNGPANSNTAPNACRTNCTLAGCGDGVIDSGEQCDGTNASACTGGQLCGSSCQCGAASNECPGLGELTLFAGTGPLCSTNADCIVGTCDPGLGRCLTATELDTGWTGIAHDSDVNDHQVLLGNLNCASSTVPCGVCEIAGINPGNGMCRCINDNRSVCDQPFQNDANDCGGQLCTCYLGPPLPLSAGNTPACVVNRFASNVSGSANVDEGSGNVNVNLRSIVFLGQSLIEPCPYCEGDDVVADGKRDGICRYGEDAGQSCDADATSTTFPAPDGGDGHSIDCFPDPGKNVSGTGLTINLAQTTSSVSLFADVDCGFPPFVKEECHCGICSGNNAFPCSSNVDCAAGGFGNCQSRGFGDPRANQCAGAGGCTLGADGDGVCDEGPTDKYCDAVVRASGDGFIQCLGDADCAFGTIGVAAGNCTLEKTRECFGRTIEAAGVADPDTPIGAAIFCIPPTGNAGINSVAGLPGPGRVVNQSRSRLFCKSDPTAQYTPGVGGCPP